MQQLLLQYSSCTYLWHQTTLTFPKCVSVNTARTETNQNFSLFLRYEYVQVNTVSRFPLSSVILMYLVGWLLRPAVTGVFLHMYVTFDVLIRKCLCTCITVLNVT